MLFKDKTVDYYLYIKRKAIHTLTSQLSDIIYLTETYYLLVLVHKIYSTARPQPFGIVLIMMLHIYIS